MYFLVFQNFYIFIEDNRESHIIKLLMIHSLYRSIMPPNSLTDEEMKAQGITNGLIRINVGLENPEDIIEDLKQALDF
ncbi:hypothetical protein Avbf_13789 [Armadillidium vulgare]|nr:hypothetical protein Avbf_13789 [Armadillidium vulgare]